MPGLSLDPRAAVFLLLLGFVPPMCFNHPLWAGGILLVALAVGGAAGAGRALLRFSPLVGLVVLASALLWPLFLREGEVVARLGPLALHHDSLLFAAAMGFRFAALTVLEITFLDRVPAEEAAWGLRGLGLPYPVAFALSISVRLAGQLGRTARTVAEAQRLRGLDPEQGGPLQRLRRYLPLLVPVLVLSLRRADRMAMAMESRGYGAGKRTSWLRWRWGGRETLLVLLALAFAGGCVWLRLQGYGVTLPGRL